jgi:hypothetical protein
MSGTVCADSPSKGEIGIIAMDALSPFIKANIINIACDPDFITWGIVLSGCDRATVICNEVYGDDPTFSSTKAIVTAVSTRTYMHCNIVNNTYMGIEFDGVCTSTDFAGNSMGDHEDGLHLNSSALIGTQTHQGNTWDGTYNNYGAYNANSANLGLVVLNRFTTHTSSSPYYPSHYDGCCYPQWFITNNSSGPWANCYSADWHDEPDCGVIAPLQEMQSVNSLDTLIATDSSLADYFPDETKQMANQQLYDKLDGNTELMQNNDVLSDFYSSLENSAYDKLKDVKDSEAAINIADSAFRAELNYYRSIIVPLSDSIRSNVKIIAAGNVDSTLLAQTAVLYSQLNDAAASLHDAEKEHKDESKALSLAASVENENISTSDLVLLASKTVNRIYLYMVAHGIDSVTSQQRAELLSVAVQCPYAAGASVYRARVILKMMHDNTTFNDDSVCQQQNFYRLQQKPANGKIKKNISAKFYPNPAAEKAVLKYSLSCSNSYLQITDIAGRVLQIQMLSSEENQFDFSTATFSNGLYLYKVISCDTEIANGKLAINK